MCSGSAPAPPPRLPEAPVAPPAPDAGLRQATSRKRAATQGGTLLTGMSGLTQAANTQPKTLLGG